MEIEAGSGGDGHRDHQDGDAKAQSGDVVRVAVADGGVTGAAPGGNGGGGGGSNNGGSTDRLIVKRLREAIQANSVS